VLSLFAMSEGVNREVVAATSQQGGTSEVSRERRESSGGFTVVEAGVCVIESGPKGYTQKQLLCFFC